MALGNNMKKTDGVDKSVTSATSDQVKTAEPSATTARSKRSDGKTSGTSNTAKKIADDRAILIVFPVAGEEYAIAIDQVKEVVSAPHISPIPQAQKYIMGVGNVRGNVYAIVDLAVRFGLHEEIKKDTEIAQFVLVVKSEEYKLAISVNKIPDTLIIEKSMIDTKSSVIKRMGVDQECIKGIVKIDNRMIIFIDVLGAVGGLEKKK